MIHVFIHFQVKEESLDDAEVVIEQFIESIRENEPGTIMYRSFQQSDLPEKFVHIMTFENAEAQKFHRNSTYCKAFVKALYPLCLEAPKAIGHDELEV